MSPKWALGALCLLASPSWGQVAYSVASGSTPALSLGASSRAEAMGGAVTALADDAFCLQFNPAGLNQVQDPQVVFGNNEWDESLGLRQEYLGWAQHFGFGSLGASVDYFGLGDLELRDANGTLTGNAAGSDLGLDLGYGYRLAGTGLGFGAAFELTHESLGDYSSSGVGGSFGALYETDHWTLGAAFLHASTQGQTPEGDVGSALRLLGDHLHCAVDLSLPQGDSPALRGGLEGLLWDLLWLRSGWRQPLGSGPITDPRAGLSVGLGIQIRTFTLDYSFTPHGDLPAAQRVSATFSFAPSLFGSRIVIDGKSSTYTAQTFYLEGVKDQVHGQKLDALVAFKQSLQAEPAYEPALQAMQKLRAELAREQGGSRGPAQEVVQRHIKAGHDLLERGQFSKARSEFEVALEVDRESVEAKQGLESVKVALKKQVQALLQSAAAADDKGDLATEVKDYRLANSLDPGEERASAALEGLRLRVSTEIKHLHRLGIDQYVAGSIEEAMATWKKGLELDPQDPYSLKRDIDKAQNLLRLRSEK